MAKKAYPTRIVGRGAPQNKSYYILIPKELFKELALQEKEPLLLEPLPDGSGFMVKRVLAFVEEVAANA